MKNPFLHRQLTSLTCLRSLELTLLDKLLCDEEELDKGASWIVEGDTVGKVSVISRGWAIRFKLLDDGRRQILNVLLPGDVVGFFALLFKTAEYAVEPVTPLGVHCFSPEPAFEAFRQAPRLAVALSWLAGQGERQLDEQIVRVGRRHATERMAHLFVELNHRLQRVGLMAEQTHQFPLTQAILADMLGMSQVHANRSFRQLVQDGLVARRGGRIQLLDTNALSQRAGFDASYLEQNALPTPISQALAR